MTKSIQALTATQNLGQANSVAGTITLDGSTNIVLRKLTVDGAFQAANFAPGVVLTTGIFSVNSSLTIDASSIINVRGDDAYFGVQNGLAVYAQQGSLTMTGSTVSNFQKQGVTAYQAAIDLSQAKVDGEVRMKLYKGGVHITGRRSPNSLYSEKIVTFEDDAGAYDQRDAEGFVKLNALRLRLLGRRDQG